MGESLKKIETSITNARKTSEETLRKARECASRTLRKHRFKTLAAALVIAPFAVEASGGFSEPVDIAEEYREDIREAAERYEASGEMMTFQEYLNQRGYMTYDEVEALERLMHQYESPVYVRSGFSLVRTLIDRFENFQAGAFYYTRFGPDGREHVLFHNGDISFQGDEFKNFVLAELAHAEQSETGELHAGNYLVDWIRYFGRRDDMYTTPDNPEGRAHGPDGIEERLGRDYDAIRDDYKQYVRNALSSYLENGYFSAYAERVGRGRGNIEIEPFTTDDLSYNDFVRFIRHLELTSRPSTSIDAQMGSQFILRLLETMPAFSADIVMVGNRETLDIIPSRELYMQFIAYLNPYTEPPLPPYGRERADEEESETLRTYMRYIDDAHDYYWMSLNVYDDVLLLSASPEDIRGSFSSGPAGYQGMSYQLRMRHEEALRESRDNMFTYAMYEHMVSRLRDYVLSDREPDPNEQNLEALLFVFSNACRFAYECPLTSGIYRTPQGELIVDISTDENGAHFKAMRDAFIQARAATYGSP